MLRSTTLGGRIRRAALRRPSALGQGQTGPQLIRMGQRYTPERLDAACRRALEVDLIDVCRVERILVQALEEEAVPQLPLPIPAGRFARRGSVFAHAKGGQS